jgi:CubicO group peptidase (beta-lactamase class C family)
VRAGKHEGKAMKALIRISLILTMLLPLTAMGGDYYPPRGEWQRKAPTELGMDPQRLAQAVVLAQEKAVVEPSDLAQAITDSFSPREPDFRILGPTKPRAGSAGLVVRKGYIVAEWGDLERVDMTFSVVKSYLSTVMALALRDGLVDDIHAPVARWVRDGKFDSDKNRLITWHHLMNQTSDWQGEMWGVPDWADRPEGDDPSLWPNRKLHEPGTYFKYNDVRINLASFALMQVWREPLPVVLKREVMDPIGASTTWRWHGYENSWVTLDGQKMQSVSGGGHFGGGLFINTLDHARMGLLFLRGGNWAGRQIVPAEWIEAMRQPTPARPDYGYMWWLNTGRERIPEAPESAFWASGFGGNYIYVDQDNDLLIVLRWIPALDEVVPAFMAAFSD